MTRNTGARTTSTAARRHRVRSLGLALALSALGAWSCGGNAATGSGTGGSSGSYSGSDICKGEFGDECGKACSDSSPCKSGMYCNGGICDADCTLLGGECPEGRLCSANGLCLSDQGAGGAGGQVSLTVSTGSTNGTGGACPDVVVDVSKQTPTALLLIDQSYSMTAPFDGDKSRWDTLKEALLGNDSDPGIIKALEKDVRFAVVLYTAFSEDPATTPAEGTQCPSLTPAAGNLKFAKNNYAAIKTIYDTAQPADDTPTGDSITAVTPALEAVSEPGPKVIIIATDGEPDTCAQLNPQEGQDEAVAAAQSAYSKGIRSFVIGVGNEIGEKHQKDMANAGAGLPPGGAEQAPIYPVNNKAALVTAFKSIIEGERNCKFELNSNVDPEDASKGEVTLDGEPLQHNADNGWKLTKPDEIELLGKACEQIKEGDHTLTVHFPCDAKVEPKVPK